jgi:predicted transcriptional regulator
MRTSDDATGLFECETCGNVGLGLGHGPDRGEIRCCDRPMRAADAAGVDTTAASDPTLDDLMGTVFDMSDTELELCLCVMEGGDLTVTELAARTEYDRSVVTRHLNHLADLGVVEKRRRLLERGGQVYVYTPADPETVRHTLRGVFLRWVARASDRLDDLRREKVESMVERDGREPQWKLFRESE